MIPSFFCGVYIRGRKASDLIASHPLTFLPRDWKGNRKRNGNRKTQGTAALLRKSSKQWKSFNDFFVSREDKGILRNEAFRVKRKAGIRPGGEKAKVGLGVAVPFGDGELALRGIFYLTQPAFRCLDMSA
jgi:hypothetical protein